MRIAVLLCVLFICSCGKTSNENHASNQINQILDNERNKAAQNYFNSTYLALMFYDNQGSPNINIHFKGECIVEGEEGYLDSFLENVKYNENSNMKVQANYIRMKGEKYDHEKMNALIDYFSPKYKKLINKPNSSGNSKLLNYQQLLTMG